MNENTEKIIVDGKEIAVKETIADSVREMAGRRPPLRANGLFRHPPDWTQEEMDFIADGLKRHLPLHIIANFVHCERNCLKRLIDRTPELRELQEQKYDVFLDTAEYQLDRLMNSGNVAAVIYALDKLGYKRGWGGEGRDGDGGSSDRIVMGTIPEEDVKAAEEKVEAAKKEDVAAGLLANLTNPGTLAAMSQMGEDIRKEAEKAAERAVEERMPKAVDAESVEVGEAPYAEETGETFGPNGFGMANPAMGGGMEMTDPWAAGAESPFFQ